MNRCYFPRQMRTGSPEFLEWARHRASFVNLFMRDLRGQLRELEQKTKRKVPVMVRIPEATLDMNLMEGLDLRIWLKEGWVDEIALDPLWIWDFDYPDTAKSYLELALGRWQKFTAKISRRSDRRLRTRWSRQNRPFRHCED